MGEEVMAGTPKRRELREEIEKRGGMEWIFSRIENGATITELCREMGREHQRDWLVRWCNKPEYKQRYEEAKRNSAGAVEDRIVDIINTTTPENAQAARVQIDGLKWVTVMRDREKYGEKQQSLVQVNIGQLALDSLRKRSVEAVTITPQIEANKEEGSEN
jgi:hypothetical protein